MNSWPPTSRSCFYFINCCETARVQQEQVLRELKTGKSIRSECDSISLISIISASEVLMMNGSWTHFVTHRHIYLFVDFFYLNVRAEEPGQPVPGLTASQRNGIKHHVIECQQKIRLVKYQPFYWSWIRSCIRSWIQSWIQSRIWIWSWIQSRIRSWIRSWYGAFVCTFSPITVIIISTVDAH